MCRYILNHKYVEESDLESEVMVPTKEAKMIIYELMENSFVQLQELKKTVSASVLGKSVYLYHCNLETVVRAQLARTHLAQHPARAGPLPPRLQRVPRAVRPPAPRQLGPGGRHQPGEDGAAVPAPGRRGPLHRPRVRAEDGGRAGRPHPRLSAGGAVCAIETGLRGHIYASIK